MTSGIYFLFRDKELIYIGQSSNLERRISEYSVRAHITMIRVIKCDPEKLKHYEARLIRFFRPICNKSHNPNAKFKSAKNVHCVRTKRKHERVIIGLR